MSSFHKVVCTELGPEMSSFHKVVCTELGPEGVPLLEICPQFQGLMAAEECRYII